MLLVQAVKNVRTPLVSVLVMLVTRVQNVILLVVVTLLVQAALYVISQQVNALAIQDSQEPHVILVTPTTTKQVMAFVQVRITIQFTICHTYFLT